MADIPTLKDWKGLLEKQRKSASYEEKDILKIVYLCQDYLREIQPISLWVGQQQGYVTQILRNFTDLYVTVSGNSPPPPSTDATVREVLLDNPQDRKRTIREVALSLTKPGDEVSDEVVLEEIKRRAMKLVANNPTAAISTVLNGFSPEFVKVQGKRGIFRRQQ